MAGHKWPPFPLDSYVEKARAITMGVCGIANTSNTGPHHVELPADKITKAIPSDALADGRKIAGTDVVVVTDGK